MIIKQNSTKRQNKKKLSLGNHMSCSQNCSIITTKHAPFAIVELLVYESPLVFTPWLPFSPFANSQRSSTHPGPVPGLFLSNQYSIYCHRIMS